MTQESGVQPVIDAIADSGRPYSIRNNELNTRCGFCGDSSKNAFHKHFYIKMEAPHPCFCQRCGFKSGMITMEILDALGAAVRDASIYVRQVEKASRRAGKRKRGASLQAGVSRLDIPQPDRTNDEDRYAIEYLESRIGGDKISAQEIERYRIITCGLYGFLEANGITDLTIHMREADRINETCIGFLSADESYIIFRTMDDEHVRKGGRRYTNYRMYAEWEGSKSFAARADVDLCAPRHRVVCTEGIIDLIQVERIYYSEARWKNDFIGVATCGAAHDNMLRQIASIGILSPDVDLYIDNLVEGGADAKLIRYARSIREKSPFFQTDEFKLNIYRNGYPNEKDFGVKAELQKRLSVKG